MFNIAQIIINVPITLIALTGHEYAHGWVSKKLGDPTPEMQGRLTFNPIAHLDPIGTLLMILTGFGWARAVQVDPRYYKDRKKGMALTAAAGPLANLIMAFAALLIYAAVYVVCVKFNAGTAIIKGVGKFAEFFAVRNLCFMVFNIIPIPPLDGAKVLGMFLPDRAYYTMLQYERYSMLLIMALSLSGVFGGIIGRGVGFFMNGMLSIINSLVGLIL